MFGAGEPFKCWRKDTGSQRMQTQKPFGSACSADGVNSPLIPTTHLTLQDCSPAASVAHSPLSPPPAPPPCLPLPPPLHSLESSTCPLAVPVLRCEDYVELQIDARLSLIPNHPLSFASSRPLLSVGTSILAKQGIFSNALPGLAQHPFCPLWHLT